jgi:hypothetical protein
MKGSQGMKEDANPIAQYEKPKISDYGDLKDLTAAQHTGPDTDAAFPPHTPFAQLTFS